MYRAKTIVFILCSIIISSVKSARILGIVPTPSYSHQIVFQPIWRELSLKGHQVVTLTTDPIKNKTLTNLTEIDLSHTYSFIKAINLVDASEKPLHQMFEDFIPFLKQVTSYQLSHPDVQTFIKDRKQHFDLILIETSFPFTLAFPERFKCPYIIISSLDSPNFVHEYFGNPSNPIVYPEFWTPFVGKMNFFERLLSIYHTLFLKYFNYTKTFPITQELINKHFNSNYPPLENIYQNVSMMFINTEPIFHAIRPLVPAVIPIGGGMHLKKPNPLPLEMQKLLDDATEGFIYFSLGTNIKSKELLENTRRVILETFAELPYKILWKFELDILKGKPSNVFISKWYPQQDIFKHPNIKLFITQGGLQSMEEAVYNSIPIVAMPFFADQPLNAKRMENKGIALTIDYKTLNKTTFKSTILEVINNPKYRKNVETLAFLVKDQQTTGLERAIWWTEYVLRHKGAQHLRGPALNVPLYQQHLLDIIGVFLLTLITILILLIILFKGIINIFGYFIINKKDKVA